MWYCSVGLEILEDLSDPDVVLVPCGGGALLAAVAASIKQALHKNGTKSCRVYGIEPEGGSASIVTNFSTNIVESI